jgi:hypothetical protein
MRTLVGGAVRDALIEAIANVEGVDESEIESAIAHLGGDEMYELDSKSAEAVLAEVGETLGVATLGPADLRPEQYASLAALIVLVQEASLVAEGK